MQPGQGIDAIPPQIFSGQIFGQQQLKPIEHFACRGFFLQTGRLAHFEKLCQSSLQKLRFQPGVMHFDNLPQSIWLRKTDVVEKAPAKEGIGQLFFIVGGDNYHWAMAGFDGFTGFIDMKRHTIEFLQQVVGKFDISLVNLIDEQNDLFSAFESLPNFAFFDIVRNIAHPFITELAVAQSADCIVFIKSLLGAGGGFDIPLYHVHAKRGCHLQGQFGFTCPWLTLDQQRAFQGHSGVHSHSQIIGGNIGIGGGKFHSTTLYLFFLNLTWSLYRSNRGFLRDKCVNVGYIPPKGSIAMRRCV